MRALRQMIIMAMSSRSHSRPEHPLNAADSARMRDLLASNRTLVAWLRTSLSYAGLGFVVAKFGLDSSHARLAEYSGDPLPAIQGDAQSRLRRSVAGLK